MRINNNLLAINTHRQLGISAGDGAKSMEKLSSGFRINRAGDDAAGLAISEKMRGQIRGLTMASKNSSDTISLIQTAEGALAETHSILQRIRELSVQSANDTNTDEDRSELQSEVRQLKSEIDRIGNTTEFNTKKLLEGSAKGVSDEIQGSVRMNNNSSVVVDANRFNSLQASVASDKSWAFDGAYMLIKTNQTFDAENKAVYEASDYRLVGPDGTQYKFERLAINTSVSIADLKAGTIISDGSQEVAFVEATAAGDIDADAVLGASLNETQVREVVEDSILAAGSSITLTSGKSVQIGASATDDLITYNANGTIEHAIGGVIEVGKTMTLDDGTVIKNEGSGKITVESGSVKLGADLAVTTDYSAITIASQSTLAEGSVVVAGTKYIEAGNYELISDGTLGVNVTIGNSIDLKYQSAAGSDGVLKLGAGSVLAKNSQITIDGNKSILLNVAGKEVSVSWEPVTGGGGTLKVGDQVVAAGKSITLEDGTVLTNTPNLADPNVGIGKITVTTGSITLAGNLEGSGTSQNITDFSVTKDSTLAAGTELGAGTILSAGTVITDPDKATFSGSVTLAYGAKNVQFSANTANSLAANYSETKVGEGFTYVFSKYQAASSNLADSIMAQIGANSGQTAFVSMGDMRCKALGVDMVDISTKWGAATAIETVNNAIQKVSHQRSSLGAIQNRLEHTIKNLDTAAENLQSAESRIRDVDMAKEVMENTKQNILQQAAQAMLAQANQAPQSVLQLLR